MTHLHPLAALTVACATAMAPTTVQAQTAEASLVVVSGDAVVTATPDRAFIGVTTESRAPGPRDAQRRNAELMKPVQDRLRAAGIAPEAMRTTAVDLRQDWDVVNGKRLSRGYVATSHLDVRIDAIDRVGEVLDAVVAAGATGVSDIRFDVKDRAKYERDALRLAVQDARARAEAAAAGAARAVDRIIRIEEQGGVMPVPMSMRATAMRELGGAPETPISAGQIEFRARVTLTAAIK